MTRLIPTIFLLLALQSGWWRWQNPQPQGNPIYSIAFRDAKRGIAVGRDGTILRTADGGTNWLVVRQVVQTPLYSLALRDRFAWAVGARGVVLFSRDGGETWKQQKSATSRHLSSVYFVDE